MTTRQVAFNLIGAVLFLGAIDRSWQGWQWLRKVFSDAENAIAQNAMANFATAYFAMALVLLVGACLFAWLAEQGKDT